MCPLVSPARLGSLLLVFGIGLSPLPSLAGGCSVDLSRFTTYKTFAATSSGKSAKAQEIQAQIQEFKETMPATVTYGIGQLATSLRESTIQAMLEAEKGLVAIQDVRAGTRSNTSVAQAATYNAVKGLLDAVFGTVTKGARVTLEAVSAVHTDMVAAQGRATPTDQMIAEVMEMSVSRAAALEQAVATMNATAAAHHTQNLTDIAQSVAALADRYAD